MKKNNYDELDNLIQSPDDIKCLVEEKITDLVSQLLLLFYKKYSYLQSDSFNQIFNSVLDSLSMCQDQRERIKQETIRTLENKYFYKITNYNTPVKIESIL